MATPINHNKPWTESELAVLLEEWAKKRPTVAEQKLISKRLGRTLETCRTRVTKLRYEHNLEMTNRNFTGHVKTTYLGVDDDPEDCWWK